MHNHLNTASWLLQRLLCLLLRLLKPYAVLPPTLLLSALSWALILVAPFGTRRLQWTIYITLCIESEGVWVYDMVNCSHLSCLEKGRFSSIAHLPAARSCACWEDLIGGYFCILELRGSGPHSVYAYTCCPLVQLGRELHAIIKASLSSAANQKEDLLTLVWQMPAVRHHYLALSLAVFRRACHHTAHTGLGICRMYIACYADFLYAWYICQNVHDSPEQTARNTVSDDAMCLTWPSFFSTIYEVKATSTAISFSWLVIYHTNNHTFFFTQSWIQNVKYWW